MGSQPFVEFPWTPFIHGRGHPTTSGLQAEARRIEEVGVDIGAGGRIEAWLSINDNQDAIINVETWHAKNLPMPRI